MKYSNFFKILITATLLASSSYAQKPVSFKDLRNKVLKKQFQNESFKANRILKSRYVSWGVLPEYTKSSINLISAWDNFQGKKEIVVAVIDTGIDPTHPFLKDNLFVPKGAASSKNYGVDFSKGRRFKNRPIDTHGHGTHVSGIVKSVFPKVKILPLKYYNRSASGKDNLISTIQALRYAVDLGVDIINYSGGGPEPDMEELEILKKAEQRGILIVAAAGNEESNIDKKKNAYFPASYNLSNIITVTAHDKNVKVLSSSNYGKKSVDISAPGHRIKSALPRSGAGFLTGTSQATAFVSGVAAMIKAQFPNVTPRQMKKIIIASAKKEITLAGKCKSGGRLDASKAQIVAAQMFGGKSNIKNIAKYRKAKAKRNLANKNGKIIYRLAR